MSYRATATNRACSRTRAAGRRARGYCRKLQGNAHLVATNSFFLRNDFNSDRPAFLVCYSRELIAESN
jgi:hypothetical protein